MGRKSCNCKRSPLFHTVTTNYIFLPSELNHQIKIQLECQKEADQAVEDLFCIAGERETKTLVRLLVEEMLKEVGGHE